MKILAFGDPHGELPNKLSSIIKKNKIDIIICVGDIGFTPEKPWLDESWKGIRKNYSEKTYRDIVNKLCSYNLPVLTLRGNMFMTDNKRIADKILRKNKNLINKFTGKVILCGITFVFFDVLWEDGTIHKGIDRDKPLSKKTREKNERRERKLNELLKENKGAILITHNPPYGFVDKAYNGEHVGSKIIFEAIKKHQPKLVLCGHIHEAKGSTKIGKTEIWNLGYKGNYKVFDIKL